MGVYTEVGKRVKSWRKWQRLTQEELGKKAGLSRQIIARLEGGDDGVPMHKVKMVCDALDVHIGEIVKYHNYADDLPATAKLYFAEQIDFLRDDLDKEAAFRMELWYLLNKYEASFSAERSGEDMFEIHASLDPDLSFDIGTIVNECSCNFMVELKCRQVREARKSDKF